MSFLKKALKETKIEPITEYNRLRKGQVIGFRGVRENIGATTLATYVAYQLALTGRAVCYLDLDFCTPNELLSSPKCQSILGKWSNSRENINVIINRTQVSSNLSYVGASTTNSVMDFLPLRVDAEYIVQKEQTLNTIVKELKAKFDILIVDIPSDLRLVESFKSIGLCDEVFTLSMYDRPCINKLQKDKAISAGVIQDNLMNTLVHVDDHISIVPKYNEISEEFNCITKIAKSSTMAIDLINGTLYKPEDKINGNNVEEHVFFTGVMSIISYLNGGLSV